MYIIFKELFEDGYVKEISNKIELDYKDFNSSEDNRIKVATTIAAISRGNDSSKNPTRRYAALLKEAAPNHNLEAIDDDTTTFKNIAGRPMEFIPVKLNTAITVCYKDGDYKICYILSSTDITDINTKIPIAYHTFLNDIMPFSYLEGDVLYTNLRALVNAGITYEEIPYTDTEYYKAVEVRAPYFVFAQIRTHSKLSQIAVSERVTTEDEYWLPEDILTRIKEKLDDVFIGVNNLNCIGCESCKYGNRLLNSRITEDVVDVFLDLPIKKVQLILKHLGYHKEVYNRWPNHLKYKTWIMGGYTNDPKAWGHFLLEREAYPDKCKSWVQEQTRITAEGIKSVIECDIG